MEARAGATPKCAALGRGIIDPPVMLPLRRASLVFVIGAAGISLISLAGCRRSTETPVAGVAPVTVTVTTAKVQDLRDTLVAQGAVVAAPTAIFTVVAPESAKIIELPKIEGATVQPGDLLARFDLTSITKGLGASAMEVSAAQRKLDAAKAEFAKQESLYSRGYTPRNTYEGAKQAVATAQTAVDQVLAQTNAATALNDRALVRAPFAGLVTHVFKSVGDVVDPTTNAAVLQLVDPTRVQAAVLVSPSQELRLAPGQAATIAVTGSMETQPATVIVAPPVAGPEGTPTIEDGSRSPGRHRRRSGQRSRPRSSSTDATGSSCCRRARSRKTRPGPSS